MVSPVYTNQLAQDVRTTLFGRYFYVNNHENIYFN